jgi:hypothetical protein
MDAAIQYVECRCGEHPSPSIPLWPETVATPPRGEREAKPLSLDGDVALGQREVGDRVLVKYSP